MTDANHHPEPLLLSYSDDFTPDENKALVVDFLNSAGTRGLTGGELTQALDAVFWLRLQAAMWRGVEAGRLRVAWDLDNPDPEQRLTFRSVEDPDVVPLSERR